MGRGRRGDAVVTLTASRTCPGPSHACMGAFVLLPYGIARHSTPLPCVGCGERFALLRYVPDALPAGQGGHLCRACDPLAVLTPGERSRGGRRAR